VRVVDDKEFLDGVTALVVEQMPQMAQQPNFRNFFRNAPTGHLSLCPMRVIAVSSTLASDPEYDALGLEHGHRFLLLG
jgi:hypothetical protein